MGDTLFKRLVSATPNNTADLAVMAKGLYIGGGGDVALIPSGQTTSIVVKAVPTGTFLPIQTLRVLATGTTATNILACN